MPKELFFSRFSFFTSLIWIFKKKQLFLQIQNNLQTPNHKTLNMNLRKFITATLTGCTLTAWAQDGPRTANYNTIPLPRSIELQAGEGFVVTADNYPQCITTRIDTDAKRWAKDLHPDEAYEISVTASGIEVIGATEAGLFYGQQTLQKAMLGQVATGDTVTMPLVQIHDSPEFSYRGVHLDCSRHFFSTDFIKRYIDIMALHGCNVLHWHLTDDQGWRFEVKKYPLLIFLGSQRKRTVIGHNLPIYDNRPHGGFYTQQECRDIVRYAAERHITVMPEIDLPGHMVAALASYPDLGCTGGSYKVWDKWGVSDDVLCAGNPQVLQFIQDVLAELIDVFPSPMIHLGGDECPKVRWRNCPRCQAKIKELGIVEHDGLKPEDQLQNWLMHEAEQFLSEHGRSMIGWDEILEGGVSETAAVMSWRGLEGGIAAARTHHNVVMTPIDHCYINFYQSKKRDSEPFSFDGYVPLSKVYGIPVVPRQLTAEEAKYILGCQVNLWTEYIPHAEQAEWMLLPRLAAISEAQWMTAKARNYNNFLERLPRLKQLYDKKGYIYSTAIE